MKHLFAFFLVAPLFGAFNVTIGTSNTQAVLRLREYSGVCTITVRENSSTGPLQPGWNAVADTSSLLTTPGAPGEKFIVIGQKTSNLALKADQQYYYTITGCGTASGTFTTKPAIMGMIMHQQPGPSQTNFEALDYPPIDWSPAGLGKWYTHPVTGIPVKLVTGPEMFILMDSNTRSFIHAVGGTGWTNGSTITTGASSTARTTNTNPMYLYANIFGPWDAVRSVENIGVVLWAHCESGSGPDCDLEMMLFDDPNVLPKEGANIITVRAGNSFTQLTGCAAPTACASTVSAAASGGTAAFPGGTDGTDGFPRPHFGGWGSFTLRQDMYVPVNLVTANNSAANTLTINTPSSGNNFGLGIKPGQHIYVNTPGTECSSTGQNDICTVASLTHSGEVTLTEPLTGLGSVSVRPLPWGVAIRKKTDVGTIRIGAQYRHSASPPYTTGTNQVKCGPTEIVRSDGVRGFPCVISYEGTFWHWVFISNDGEKIHPVGALLAGSGVKTSAAFLHATNPRIVYGERLGTLYQFQYNGDWGVSATRWERDPPAGARYHNGENYFPDPDVTVTVKMTASTVASAIAKQYPQYVAPPYPAATGGFGWILSGISGDLVLYSRIIVTNNNCQDCGPGQYAVFNLASGELIDFIDAGTDTELFLSFGETHSRSAVENIPNTIRFDYNLPGAQTAPTTSALLHGPHQIRIEAIRRGGAWSTNTCLQWPIGTGGTSNDLAADCPAAGTDYDKTCPSVGAGANQIPQSFADVGAQGNNCMTLKVSGATAANAICSEAGNDAGTNDDFALYGACTWNAASTYSGGPELKRGMKFVDRIFGHPFLFGGFGAAAGNSENFRVLTIVENGDGTLTVAVQRNASREYCCANGTANPAGDNCSQTTDPQAIHADGWSGMMVSGTFGSCNQMTQYVQYPDPTTKVGRVMIETPIELARGHSGFGPGTGTGIRYISGTGSRDLNPFSQLNIQPPPKIRPHVSKFNGLTTPIGGYLQQYINQGQRGTNDTWKHFSGDMNFLAGGAGEEQNGFAGGIPNERVVFTQVTAVPDLWRITVGGSGNVLNDLKKKPIVGWCGPHALTDISSPATGNVIDSAPMYSYCVPYKNTQCRAGSVGNAGTAWVKCPYVFKHPTAATADDLHTGLEFANEPSLLSIPGNAGMARRFYSAGSDMTGNNQMMIGDFFSPAGTPRAFWSAVTHPGGIGTMTPSGRYANGIRQVLWFAKVPKFPIEGSRVAGFKPVTVQLGARTGVTHARIKFGNNPQFECNAHYKTACYTDATITPYALWHADGTDVGGAALTATACASGCTLTMNVVPGEMLWYEVETSTNGTTFTPDPVQVIAP